MLVAGEAAATVKTREAAAAAAAGGRGSNTIRVWSEQEAVTVALPEFR